MDFQLKLIIESVLDELITEDTVLIEQEEELDGEEEFDLTTDLSNIDLETGAPAGEGIDDEDLEVMTDEEEDMTDVEEGDVGGIVMGVPDDPVQAVIDDVTSAMELTQNPQDLLNVAKSSIQMYFDNYQDAFSVVDSMRMEEHPIFKDIAMRLSIFIQGM